MNKYDIKTQVRKKNPYKEIMKKTQEHTTCANILNRQFKQTEPLKTLCTDITYLYYGRCEKHTYQQLKILPLVNLSPIMLQNILQCQ